MKFGNHYLLWVLLSIPALALGQPLGKSVLLEKITSAGCPSCPNGDLILQDLLSLDSTLVPVAIHVHNSGHVDSMACPDGDSILADFLWAHPTLMVDRFKFASIPYVAGTINSWPGMIQQRQVDPLIATIGGSSAFDTQTRALEITLYGTVLWQLDWDLRVNAYVVENGVSGNGLGWDQLNGNNNTQGHPLQGLGDPIVGYVHNWVLRDMLGGPRGLNSFPRPVPAGYAFSHTFQTQLHPRINSSNAYIILVVQRYDQNKEQREILNVAKLGLNASVLAGMEQPSPEAFAEVWPQPAEGKINIQMGQSKEWAAVLRDLQGRACTSTKWTGEGISWDLPAVGPGLYVLEVCSPGGYFVAKKLILQ